MSDLFCLRHCCRRAGLPPHEVLARKALRPERAKIIDAHYDAPGLAGLLRAHEGRHRESGHVGRPGHREEPQFGAGPLARGDGPGAGRGSAARGHRVRSSAEQDGLPFHQGPGRPVEGGEPGDGRLEAISLPVPEEHQQLVPSGCFPGRQPHNVGCQDRARLQPRTGPLLEIYQRRRLLRFY